MGAVNTKIIEHDGHSDCFGRHEVCLKRLGEKMLQILEILSRRRTLMTTKFHIGQTLEIHNRKEILNSLLHTIESSL